MGVAGALGIVGAVWAVGAGAKKRGVVWICGGGGAKYPPNPGWRGSDPKLITETL